MAGAIVSAMIVAGCGATVTRTGPGAHEPAATVHVGAVELLVVTRATAEHVALGLWIDAGALDGQNPTVAIVAADVAAAEGSGSGGPAIEPVVFPDGTLLRVLCRRSDLDRCVTALGRSLSTRAVDDGALARAVERARARRDAGLGDPVREAHALALSGALGLPVHPLGEASDEVPASAVESFLAAHYGAGRVLLVVVGDVVRDAVASLVRAGLEEARAHASRATRASGAGPRVLHEEGRAPAVWTFALRARSPEEALGSAAAWARRGPLLGSSSVAAFPTRLGWVALLTIRGDAAAARTAAGWLDAPPEPAPPPPAEDAWSIVERVGARWVAAEVGEPARWGLGVVGPAEPEELADVAAVVEHGAPRGSVSLAEVEGAGAAAVVWRLPGPELEGPHDHGSSAIAAHILAARCAAQGSVTISGSGVLVTREGEAASILADAAFWEDCVAAGAPSTGEIERARSELVATSELGAARRAAVAAQVAPGAPGAIAPTPSRSEIAEVEPSDVVARWARWATDAQWSFAGDRSALARIRSSSFGRTERTGSAEPVEPAEVRPTSDGGDGGELRLDELAERELLVSARLDGCSSTAGARAALDLWVATARGAGARVTWREAGSAATLGLAWMALSLAGDGEALERAFGAIAALDLDEALRRGSEAEAAARSLAAAGPLGTAVAGALATRSTGACRPTLRRVWLVPAPTGRR